MGNREEVPVATGDGLLGETFTDVTLTAIVWSGEGVDLEVAMPGPRPVKSGPARFVCRWLHVVEISLDSKWNPGPPLTWSGRVRRSPTGSFRLELDFASAGSVTIECDELELRSLA